MDEHSDYEYIQVQYTDEPEATLSDLKPSKSARNKIKVRVPMGPDVFNLREPPTTKVRSAPSESFADKYKRVQELDLLLDAINNRRKG
jgi:hypothetical protein